VLAKSGADELPVLIAERDARAKQVRVLAVGGPAKIHRMAAGAVRFVERLAANDHVLRGNRTRELREAPGPAAAPASTLRRRLTPTSALCGRRLGLPLRGWRSWSLRLYETRRPRAR
jgi:hypothetical protein